MHERPEDKARPDRVLNDAALVERLQAQGFDPDCEDWILLSGTLIEYGLPVLRGWFVAGAVYEAARKVGRSGVRGLARIPRDLRLPPEDAHDLALAVLESVIPRFRETLQRGCWQPEGGANLTTFFVGRCLMQLPDVHERWRRQRDRWASEMNDLADADDGHRSTDPADVAVAAVSLDEMLPPEAHEHVRVMIELSQAGYSMAEIAEMFSRSGLPCTEAGVRSKINRARNRARKQARQWRERDDRGDPSA